MCLGHLLQDKAKLNHMKIYLFSTILRGVGGRVMVFKATFNNISVISWRSVLMVEETGENHRPATMHHLKKIYFYRSILNIDHLQDSTILDVTLILLKLLFKKSRPVTCDLICFLILL